MSPFKTKRVLLRPVAHDERTKWVTKTGGVSKRFEAVNNAPSEAEREAAKNAASHTTRGQQ